jgi:hypothetical protein
LSHADTLTDLDISPEDYEALSKVVEKLHALGGPDSAKDLEEEDRELLLKRLAATRKHINTAPHSRPMGVLHDTHHVLASIDQEVSDFYLF